MPDPATNPLRNTDSTGLACGSGWSEYVVPDRFPSYSLTDCCQEHDDCYGCKGKKQGTTKDTCDVNFYNCMLKGCQKLDGDSKRGCEDIAKLYYAAVKRYGDSAFKNGRKECCGATGSW